MRRFAISFAFLQLLFGLIVDEHLPQLFDRFDADGSGLMDDEEWDLMAPKLTEAIGEAFPHLLPEPEPEPEPDRRSQSQSRSRKGSS